MVWKTIAVLLQVVIIIGAAWLLLGPMGLLVSGGQCLFRFFCNNDYDNNPTDDDDDNHLYLRTGSKIGLFTICPWLGFVFVASMLSFAYLIDCIFNSNHNNSNNNNNNNNNPTTIAKQAKQLLGILFRFFLTLVCTALLYFPSLVVGDLFSNGQCYAIQSCKSVSKFDSRPGRWVSKDSLYTGWPCVSIGAFLFLIPLFILDLYIFRRQIRNNNNNNANLKKEPEQPAA